MLTKKESKALNLEVKKLESKTQSLRVRTEQIKDKLYRSEIEPIIERLVGKCFKYRNSYGGDRQWWLYCKVVGHKKTQLIVCIVQTDCYGKVMIESNSERFSYRGCLPQNDSLFQFPITTKQFNAAVNRALKQLEKFKRRGGGEK